MMLYQSTRQKIFKAIAITFIWGYFATCSIGWMMAEHPDELKNGETKMEIKLFKVRLNGRRERYVLAKSIQDLSENNPAIRKVEEITDFEITEAVMDQFSKPRGIGEK